MAKNYQDTILNQLRKENIPSTIFLTNGFQIRGCVKGFDQYVVVIETEGKQQMLYKHAISTIAPMRNLDGLFDNYTRLEMKVI